MEYSDILQFNVSIAAILFDFYIENKPILSKNRLIFIPVIPGNRFPFPGTSGNEYFREIPGNPGNGIPGNQPYSDQERVRRGK